MSFPSRLESGVPSHVVSSEADSAQRRALEAHVPDMQGSAGDTILLQLNDGAIETIRVRPTLMSKLDGRDAA
jgi:hypothetical protein